MIFSCAFPSDANHLVLLRSTLHIGEETRREGGYDCELTEDDHRELVGILLELKAKVILSGYAHPIYEPLMQAGWERVVGHTQFCSRV